MPNIRGYVLSEELADELVEMLDRLRPEPLNVPPNLGGPKVRGQNVQFLRVTEATLVGPGGVIWYTARLLQFTPSTGAWADHPDAGALWLVQIHNFGLRPEQRVEAKLIESGVSTAGVSHDVPLLDDQGIPLFDELGVALIDDAAEQLVGDEGPMFVTSDKLAVLGVRCEAGAIVTDKG